MATTTTNNGQRYNLVLLPAEVEVEGCTVIIHEVTKLAFPSDVYYAACQVKCNDSYSNIFPVTYRDTKELALKLKTEVSKFKYMLWLYGKDELKQLGLVR